MTPKINIKDWTDASNRVEYIRVTLEYPISHFAKKTGCSQETIEKILEGKAPSFPHMTTMVKIFPIRDAWLFSGEGQPWVDGVDLKKYKYSKTEGLNRAMKYGNDERVARFKEVRSNHVLSQVLFADRLETSRDTVSAIENGRQEIPMYIAEQLHAKFNVDMNWFISGTVEDWRFSEDLSLAAKTAKKEELLKEIANLNIK